MKRFLLVFITTIISFGLRAQKTDTARYADDDKIYTDSVEVMPEFTGGMKRLYARLENIDYLFLDRMNGRTGETILILIIEKDGEISNIKVVHGLSIEQDNEIIRVVKHLKKWKPGMQAGKPVRVQYAIPINFKLLN
ncbi:MAG TPA: energy transducer TonB [Mucilaginibacter sp.]|jgi:protein TonB